MEILRAIAELRTPFGEKLWQILTFLGEETFIVVVLCLLFWCINKNLSYKIGATFFLGGLLTQGLKITFQIPRPWVLDETFEIVESAGKNERKNSDENHVSHDASCAAPLCCQPVCCC